MIRRTTWLVLGIFIGLTAVAIVVNQNKIASEENSTPTPGAEFLFDLENKEITALSVENEEGNIIEIKLDEEGKWIFEDPGLGVVDTSAFDSVISRIGTLRMLAKISPPPAAVETGLDQPAYIFRLGFTDGTQSTIQTGKITPTESGYYVITDKNEVLVINKFGIDEIGDLLLNPPIAEKVTQTPNP